MAARFAPQHDAPFSRVVAEPLRPRIATDERHVAPAETAQQERRSIELHFRNGVRINLLTLFGMIELAIGLFGLPSQAVVPKRKAAATGSGA